MKPTSAANRAVKDPIFASLQQAAAKPAPMVSESVSNLLMESQEALGQLEVLIGDLAGRVNDDAPNFEAGAGPCVLVRTENIRFRINEAVRILAGILERI